MTNYVKLYVPIETPKQFTAAKKLRLALSQIFDGFTVYEVLGYWHKYTEKTQVIELYDEKAAAAINWFLNYGIDAQETAVAWVHNGDFNIHYLKPRGA